jgi:MFS transporter, Spinster family, sphingosine-1-phosphate transporter
MLMGTVWSLASVGCMFAGSYGSLLAFRGIVGAGEAGYGPAGAALLAHHFPTRMRCTVVGGFLFACALGTMAGIVAGGVLASRWGWQAAFGIVGVPGLVAALLVLTIRDFDTVPVHAAVRDGARVLDAARELFRAPSMWAICVGSGLGMMEAMAISVWAPSFFERTYGLDGAAAGVKAAPVILACAVGTVLWGAVADRASLRTPRRRLDVTTGCCVATIAILFPAFLWMQSGHAQYVAILLGALAIGGFVGIPFAAVMDVTPRGLRATACAVLVLANNAIASATGPFVTGLLSDRVGLPHALALVTLFALPTAACFAWAARHYEADARRVGAAESPVAFTIAAPAPMT